MACVFPDHEMSILLTSPNFANDEEREIAFWQQSFVLNKTGITINSTCGKHFKFMSYGYSVPVILAIMAVIKD